jgi:hypothetical protein
MVAAPTPDAADAGCRVGPGRGARLSTSPFPRTALRSRVPVIPAPGSPRGPSPTNGCVAARLRSTRAGLPGRSPVFTGSCCPADPPPQPRCALRHVHAARVLGLLRALATTRPNSRRRTCPPPEGGEGSDLVAAHVHHHHHPVDEVGVQLYPGGLARGTPQAFPLATPPAITCRLRSRSPPSRRACTADRPRSARLEPARRLGLAENQLAALSC